MDVEDQRYVVAYLLHDAEANMEGYVSDYSPGALAEAEAAGMVILAEYSDGSRKRVSAADVREPAPKEHGIALATPSYVDQRTEATVAVFDALAAIVAPDAATFSADGAGEAQADPVEAFMSALAALRALEPERG